MEQVWKCDHCTETNVDSDVMAEHEKSCYMNPEAKDCGTCKNHESVPFENMTWACKFGWDFEDEKNSPCDKWERK